MHALKTPIFLKPRPSSPASAPVRSTDMVPGGEVATLSAPIPRRPLTRLQNPFKRSSSSSPAPTPNPVPLPDIAIGVGGPQYIDIISLKFAEAVSKALANPSSLNASSATSVAAASDPSAPFLRGRKPLPSGRGAALGKVIAEELRIASSDVYLHRAVIRILHRPLSVLFNNLSTLLLPILPFIESSNVAQCHALSLATLAAELLESMDDLSLGLGHIDPMNNAGGRNGDGLRGVREGLESLVRRVVQPLMGSVSTELGAILDTLADPVTHASDSHAVTSLSNTIPSAAQRLLRYTAPNGPIAQATLATLLIGLVWRSLTALSTRPLPDAHLRVPPTMTTMTNATKMTPPGLKAKKELPFTLHMSSRPSTANGFNSNVTSSTNSNSISNSTSNTPPTTPRFGRIPLPSLSRPPSPQSISSLHHFKKVSPLPTHQQPLVQLAMDAQNTLNALSGLPSPSLGSFAREAVDEAFEALEAFIAFLKWVGSTSYGSGTGLSASSASLSGNGTNGGATNDASATNGITYSALVEKTEDVPALVILPILLQLVSPSHLPPSALMTVSSNGRDEYETKKKTSSSNNARPTVSGLLGISEAEYRASCLVGFGRAEMCVGAVGRGVLDELEKPDADLSSEKDKDKKEENKEKEKGGQAGGASVLDVDVLRAWLVERLASAVA